MPIPVSTDPDDGGPGKPDFPVPEMWQRTYVSIRGANGEGEEIPLTGFSCGAWPAIILQPGATGLDLPPYQLYMDDSPNLDGSIVRGARAAARPILLPVFVYGIDRKTVRAFKRKLGNALNPRRGYCVLTFMEQDGVARRLRCYYAGGMEGNESVGNAGFTWISYGIQLTAADPYFYGDTEVGATWTFGASRAFLHNPFFPVQLSKGTPAQNIITVENPGDIEAWPLWTITGPVRSLKFTGPDGTTWELPEPSTETDVLAAGRTLTVDCRPGAKTLKDDRGRNYFHLLSPNPSLWSVPPGESTVKTNLVAGSGTPTVGLRLHPRYETY
ncbi:phage tail family protein [Streptomyces sp. p1417]|uniref:Phage tail family protein n=1 Tax=Streptomyces typhae TaxID=2681492 RepID=A0A6L6X131_9ACTN|nr:phage tail domain-containing protein [Streptomyces typhae]MVO87426.1 phage tail family protein [Streptomyces typhae]